MTTELNSGSGQLYRYLPPWASPLIFPAALLGIPAAGCVALVFSLQIPRLLYGEAQPLFAIAEFGGLLTVLALVILLRSALSSPLAPRGFYRAVLDFLAMSGWHPAVAAAFAGLIVLPTAWYVRGVPGIGTDFKLLGTRALALSDVQNWMDGIVAVNQLALTAGVPLLFAVHMLARWKPKWRFLPWLLLPLLLLGVAVGVVLLVALGHS